MVDLPLVFLGGLLGATHCIGMCGGFALALGAGTTRWQANLVRQLLYTLGRVATYALLGAIAAFVGTRLTRSFSSLHLAQAVLATVAGAALIGYGLHNLGWLPSRAQGQSSVACLAGKLFLPLFQVQHWSKSFAAGVMTGFLPCGLVYTFLVLAASSGNLAVGALRMAVFGAGTAPLMIAAGCASGLVSATLRRRVMTFAAWCVIVTGMISLSRGYYAYSASAAPPEAARQSCPFCQP